MKERKATESNIEKRLLAVADLCTFLSMGKTRAVEFAKECGAERKIGRRCLYDRKIISEVIDNPDEFYRVTAAMKE